MEELYDIVGFSVVPEDYQNTGCCHFENNSSDFEGYSQMSVEEILNYPDLDAVFIECEDRALTKYALMAAEKGLHIHMDKPGGIDNDEFNRLIDLVSEKSSAVEIGGFNRRQIVVSGSKGTVEIYPTEIFSEEKLNAICAISSRVRTAGCKNNENVSRTHVFGRYDGMLRAFAQYVYGEKENPYTYEYEKGLHKLILKACGKEN